MKPSRDALTELSDERPAAARWRRVLEYFGLVDGPDGTPIDPREERRDRELDDLRERVRRLEREVERLRERAGDWG